MNTTTAAPKPLKSAFVVSGSGTVHLENGPCDRLSFDRVGLTAEQVAERKLCTRCGIARPVERFINEERSRLA